MSTPITGTTPATLTGAAFLIASIDPSRLPTTEEGVRQLVARMPATMGGKAATQRDKREVKYADGTRFVVESETTAAPGMSMEQFFPIFLSHGGFTVTAQSKPGASLLWFVAHGRPPYQAHLAGVASPTETWLFGVDAASSAACDDLVAALAAAVR